ncbi:IS3 family transposase [Sulfobacillus thermosulfidooxidans]|uniref:IS3 family transposase n=1 Tax=Sulfobacillus thermosulfidooxidans TaxID=28034 RepID=UPI0023787F58|nr:IS3 family transposase [Sulfobacillus thermosulfidooxidans]
MANQYDRAFKEQAVQLVLTQQKSGAQVARELGIPSKTLYAWVAAYKADPVEPFVGRGHLKAEDQALRDLQRRIRDLEEENAIPKKSDAHLHQRSEVIFPFIHEHRFTFSITKMCQILDVSRSGYYAWRHRPPSTQAQVRTRRVERIRAVFTASGERYGSPKITAVLRREGERIRQKTVARLMHDHRLRSRVTRKYKATTNSRHTLPVHENVLNQTFTADRPHAVWMADITYIPTEEGWLYLASLEDLYTRKIVGWAVDRRMTQDLVLRALDRAVRHSRPPAGVLHHSDRGSQYAATAYQERLKQYGMTASMSRKGNCYDNAMIESWHSLLKKELIYLTKFRTRAEADVAIFAYIEIFYNRQRVHSALDYQTPAEAEAAYQA